MVCGSAHSSATVAAIAALSECRRSGSRRLVGRGRARAPPAEAPSRSPPTSSVTRPARSRVRDRAAPARDRAQRPAARRESSSSVADAGQRDGEDRAHARPRRPWAVGVRRSRDRAPRQPAPKACAQRMIVPTLPGSRTPCRYTHSGPAGLRPSAPRRRPARACPSRAARRRQQLALDLVDTRLPGRVPGRARNARSRSPHAAPAARRRRSGPRPRPRTVPLRSRSRRRWLSRRRAFRCGLWGLVIMSVSEMSWARRKRKGAGSDRSGARKAVGLVGWVRTAGRQRLAGALGKTSEGVGVVHGHVGQHLAVELDPGERRARA